jgi:hypothetical protein
MTPAREHSLGSFAQPGAICARPADLVCPVFLLVLRPAGAQLALRGVVVGPGTTAVPGPPPSCDAST